LAVGNGICAEGTPANDIAVQNASPMTAAARRFFMTTTVEADRA
jgi:hypothetical protein